MVSLLGRQPVAAAENEQSRLQEIEKLLYNDSETQAPQLVGPKGDSIELPDSLFYLLQQLVHELAQGHVVTLVSTNKELTTQQAADLLNVSRPFLIKLLEDGNIPFTKTGTHRRIKFFDLIGYKKQRDEECRRGLAQLTEIGEELGLSD